MNDWLVFVVVTVPFMALELAALVEVARRHDLAAGRKVAWLAAILVIPIIGLATYLVVRPSRPVASSRVGAGTERAEAVVALAERRQRGAISDDGYLTAMRELTTAPR